VEAFFLSTASSEASAQPREDLGYGWAVFLS